MVVEGALGEDGMNDKRQIQRGVNADADLRSAGLATKEDLA